MKWILIVFFIPLTLCAHAQFDSESVGKINLGAGYTHDFPRLNGYTIAGEFVRPITAHMEVGFGVKHIDLKGNPRTSSVQEYTRANTIDFNLYFVPLQNDIHTFRMGIGYAFSIYNVRRTHPRLQTHGPEQITAWPIQDHKGKISGVSLIGEYEYSFPESNFSLGIRAGWYKAYDRVTYIGPFAGIRI